MNESQIRKMNEGLALITGVLSAALLVRVMLGPDAIQQVRMRILRKTAHVAGGQADFWLSVQGSANTAYHRLTAHVTS